MNIIDKLTDPVIDIAHKPDSDERTRLSRAFKLLRQRGVDARWNYLCCGSCACSQILIDHGGDQNARYVFFHKQAAEAFADNGFGRKLTSSLWLSHGPDVKTGKLILATLQACGLDAHWDGDTALSIEVRPS